jgi:hypothetical protein
MSLSRDDRVDVMNNHPLQGLRGTVLSATTRVARVRLDGGLTKGVEIPVSCLHRLGDENISPAPFVYRDQIHAHDGAGARGIGNYSEVRAEALFPDEPTGPTGPASYFMATGGDGHFPAPPGPPPGLTGPMAIT